MPEKPERPEDCPTCRGRLEIDLPVQDGPDSFDTIERPCPTCCAEAWPKGFPGLKGIASGRRWWLIEPTGSFAGREA